MKHNDWYYEGLNLTFKAELFEEVISILKTIKKFSDPLLNAT